MTLDITIAIPTYNGENRLSSVLDCLKNQIGIDDIKGEIIIVDNNSTDQTKIIITNYQQSWNHPFSLRYLLETKQGAAYARNTAIQAAKSEIICFLDDDNLPEPNWIIESQKFAINNPQAGAIASRISGKFEVQPPENIKSILFYLAITERGDKPHLFERKKGFPPSAGLVIRRQAWLDNVPANPLFIGRVGKSMLGSEDAEALCYVQKAGWEIWYNPAMHIQHVIPASRLEHNYLISLMKSVGLGRHHLRMLMLPTWQKPLAFFTYLLNDIRKLLLHYLRHYQLMNTQDVSVYELARLQATVISPFFLMSLRIQRFLARIKN